MIGRRQCRVRGGAAKRVRLLARWRTACATTWRALRREQDVGTSFRRVGVVFGAETTRGRSAARWRPRLRSSREHRRRRNHVARVVNRLTLRDRGQHVGRYVCRIRCNQQDPLASWGGRKPVEHVVIWIRVRRCVV